MNAMNNRIFAAIAYLNNVSEVITNAERVQSTMDPIEGPGTREWEIIRERIASLEADIRLAMDEPGALEKRVDLDPVIIDTWDDNLAQHACLDSMTIKPQYSGIWIDFDFGEEYGIARVYARVTYDALNEGFIDIGVITGEGNERNDRRVHVQRAKQPWPLSEVVYYAALEEASAIMDTGGLRDVFAMTRSDDYLDTDPELFLGILIAAESGGCPIEELVAVRDLL